MSRDSNYANLWVDGRQLDLRHFYGIGDNAFSVGFCSHDGVYQTGIVTFDPTTETFSPVRGVWDIDVSRSRHAAAS